MDLLNSQHTNYSLSLSLSISHTFSLFLYLSPPSPSLIIHLIISLSPNLLYHATLPLSLSPRSFFLSSPSLPPLSLSRTPDVIFISAALASCMVEISVQDPVSHIQIIERNLTTVYMRSDPTVCTIRNARSESCSILTVPTNPYINVRR